LLKQTLSLRDIGSENRNRKSKIFHGKQSYIKQAPDPDHKPAPNLLKGITLLLKFIRIIERHKSG
jgi:hypothetical protein